MNCGKAQRWLSARQDGMLTPARAARLAAHVAACSACRAFEAQLGALTQGLQAHRAAPAPTPEAAWADVQRALRQQAPAGERRVTVPWALWVRVAAMLGVLTVGGLVLSQVWSGFSPVGVATAAPATEVLRVTTELAGASTMVYEDHGTGWTVVWVLPPEDGNDARM